MTSLTQEAPANHIDMRDQEDVIWSDQSDAPLPSFFEKVGLDADGHGYAQSRDAPASPGGYTYSTSGQDHGSGKSKDVDKLESKFRIGLQSFKEKVGAQRWKSVFGEQASFQVTRTPEVDGAVKKIKNMEQYYFALEKSLSAYSKSLKNYGEMEGDMARFWLEQGFKEGENHLRTPQIDLGNAQQAAAKEILQCHAVVDNVRNAISTMLKNAIADAADTAKRQESARQEMDGFATKLQAVFEKANERAEKAAKTGKASSDPGKEIKEIEAAKAQFEAAKEKYARLTTQLLDKADMLEAKRTSDIPEQVGALKRAGHNYLFAALQAFAPKAETDE